MAIVDLGLIAALISGPTAPTNTKILWYDTNVSLHKYYDTTGGTWVALVTAATTPNLTSVLTIGNASSGINVEMTNGDSVLFKGINGDAQLNDTLDRSGALALFNFPITGGTLMTEGFLSLSNTLIGGTTTGGNDIDITSGDTINYLSTIYNGAIGVSVLTANRTYTLPNKSGTIALISDIQAIDTLAETLAIGNTTGANDIIASQVIKSSLGGGQVDFSVINELTLTNDNGVKGDSGLYVYVNGVDTFIDGESSAWKLSKVGANDHVYGFTLNASMVLSDDINDLALTKSGIFVNGGTASWTTPASDTTAAISSRAVTFGASVTNSVAVGGLLMTPKTNNTLYANQISLQASSITFDALLVPTTITADRTYTFQDASGTVAFLSDIALTAALATRYVLDFTIFDWTSSVLTITGVTHAKGVDPVVQILEGAGVVKDIASMNEISIDSTTGDVTITVTEGSEFEGRVVIL